MPHEREHSSPDRNPDSFVADMVNAVHSRVDTIVDQLKVPTIPQYDSTNFPDEAAPGQIVRDVNDMEVLWIYGSDNAWHQIGGSGLKWAIASTIDTTVPNNTSFFEIPFCPPRPIDPGDGRGSSYFLSNAEGSVYDKLGGSLKGINILSPGTYLFLASCSKAAGAAFDTSLADRASTSGKTSLELQIPGTQTTVGSSAGFLMFYNFTALDLAGVGGSISTGVDIFQASGSDKFYNFATMALIRISDAFPGFLP